MENGTVCFYMTINEKVKFYYFTVNDYERQETKENYLNKLCQWITAPSKGVTFVYKYNSTT